MKLPWPMLLRQWRSTHVPLTPNQFSSVESPSSFAAHSRHFSGNSESMSSSHGKSLKESVIRKMTRLAEQHGAINLSQGFPNEAPPRKLRMALAHGVLTGKPWQGDESDIHQSLMDFLQTGEDSELDILNQYSPPMGRPDVRQAISKYYRRFYDYGVSPDDITVTLGATEAFACALRAVGRPGDKCVILEPFHELYPSQCRIFYLEQLYVTLRVKEDKWTFDPDELESALSQAKMLLLNSPHNPTGKVFTRDELRFIVDLCLKYDVYIITDEIYEHMIYSDSPHIIIPKDFPEIAERTLVCNSMGKSASATGWRLGWCLHPPHLRDAYRAIHDQIAVMSPHPMQYASLAFLTLPDTYFDELSSRYQGRVRKLGKVLEEVGFSVVQPEAAYYLFVDFSTVPALQGKSAMEASMYLLETVGVACVPGDNFYGQGEEGGKYIRFAACRSDNELNEAATRLQSLKVD